MQIRSYPNFCKFNPVESEFSTGLLCFMRAIFIFFVASLLFIRCNEDAMLKSCPCESWIRTDGYYLFDNGKDTIVGLNADEMVIFKDIQATIEKQYPDDSSRWQVKSPCVPIGTVPTEGSTFLEYLAFPTCTTGMAYISVCRDSVSRQINIDSLRAHIDIPHPYPKAREGDHISDYHCDSFGAISLLFGPKDNPTMMYTGYSFRDSLVLIVQNRALPRNAPIFLQRRSFVFYPFESSN